MNIYQTIAKIIEEVPAIGKNKTNTTQNFKFRGIDDVMNTLQPMFSKHKLFIVPEVLEQTREERTSARGGNLIYSICKIKYTFYAEDGSNISATVIGEGMDSGDKATNKAMAIAMKYAMFQVFCIPTEEMKDPDSESPEVTPKNKSGNKATLTLEQTVEINDMIMNTGADKDKIKEYFKVKDIIELDQDQYVEAKLIMSRMQSKLEEEKKHENMDK